MNVAAFAVALALAAMTAPPLAHARSLAGDEANYISICGNRPDIIEACGVASLWEYDNALVSLKACIKGGAHGDAIIQCFKDRMPSACVKTGERGEALRQCVLDRYAKLEHAR
jgi:hypothetical protein